jgi:uncharacterized protein
MAASFPQKFSSDRCWASLLSITLSVLLLGCTSLNEPSEAGGNLEQAQQTPQAQQVQSSSRGQQLPITAEAEMAGEVIQLEVARTAQQQAMGLMFRPALPDDRGMLFPLDPPRTARFWMRNVPVPLDMVFLRNGEVKAIETAPPCNSFSCPTYGPSEPVDAVIELRGGRAAELGLQVGDRVTLRSSEDTTAPQ